MALIIWFDSNLYIIPQKFPKSPKTFKIPKSALLGDEIPKVGQPAGRRDFEKLRKPNSQVVIQQPTHPLEEYYLILKGGLFLCKINTGALILLKIGLAFPFCSFIHLWCELNFSHPEHNISWIGPCYCNFY